MSYPPRRPHLPSYDTFGSGRDVERAKLAIEYADQASGVATSSREPTAGRPSRQSRHLSRFSSSSSSDSDSDLGPASRHDTRLRAPTTRTRDSSPMTVIQKSRPESMVDPLLRPRVQRPQGAERRWSRRASADSSRYTAFQSHDDEEDDRVPDDENGLGWPDSPTLRTAQTSEISLDPWGEVASRRGVQNPQPSYQRPQGGPSRSADSVLLSTNHFVTHSRNSAPDYEYPRSSADPSLLAVPHDDRSGRHSGRSSSSGGNPFRYDDPGAIPHPVSAHSSSSTGAS